LEQERVVHDQLKEKIKEEIVINDSAYIEFKNIMESDQTVLQFIQCKMYEMVSDYKKLVSNLRRDNSTLAENLQRTSGDYELLKHQTTHLNKIKEELDREYKKQFDLYQAKNEKLTEELQDTLIQYNESKAKSSMYDQVKLKADTLEGQTTKLQHRLEVIESQLHMTSKENEEFIRKLTTTTQQLELLKNDKGYLTKENETLSAQMRKTQDEHDRLYERLKEVKRQKNEYYNRLLQVKDESKSDADRNMQTEIKRMREKMKKDLESIKQNAQATFERENRMLRDAKDHAENQAEKLRLQLKESQDGYDQLNIEYVYYFYITFTNYIYSYRYNTLRNTMEKQLNQLNSDINVKNFKIETITMSLMQTNNNLKQCQGEIEVMRKKLDVLKTAYYNLESESKERITKLETMLGSKDKELQNYHQIETELDKALEGMGVLQGMYIMDS
jgi:progesterone-induced-blocking factor 1